MCSGIVLGLNENHFKLLVGFVSEQYGAIVYKYSIQVPAPLASLGLDDHWPFNGPTGWIFR